MGLVNAARRIRLAKQLTEAVADNDEPKIRRVQRALDRIGRQEQAKQIRRARRNQR